MMRPAEMKKVVIVTHKYFAAPLIRALHEEGLLQVKETSKELSEFAEESKGEERIFLHFSMRFRRILTFFDVIKDIKGSETKKGNLKSKVRAALNNIYSALFPGVIEGEEIDKLEVDELINRLETSISEIENEVSVFETRLNEIDSEKDRFRDYLNTLKLLEPLDVNVEYLKEENYKFCKIWIGTISLEKVKELEILRSLTNECLFFHAEEIDGRSLVVVITTNEFMEVVNDFLLKVKFESIELPEVEGTPSESVEKIERALDELEAEEKRIIESAYEIVKENEWNMLLNHEISVIEAEREGITPFLLETKNAVILEAWCPKRNLDRVKKLSEEITDGCVLVEEAQSSSEEEPPVLLENPKLIKPYEMLTGMFGLPKKGELDPTLIIAVFFTVFFGFMLTDAIYGLMAVIFALLVKKGHGKINESINDVSSILIIGGLSAIFFGILTGSYLGDFSERFLNFETKPIWVDPFATESLLFLGHPISPVLLVLVVSVLLGAVHMDIGILISFKNALENKNLREAIGQVGLLTLEIGLILVLFKLFGVKAITEKAFKYGLYLLLVGSALVIVRGGPLGFFDCTGLLGDLISYSRILALAMATGGLALAVNVTAYILATTMGLAEIGGYTSIFGIISNGMKSPFGLLALFLVFLILFIGHLTSFGLNSLGGFIHSLRLHYAELFGKFYEGGGDKYIPFRAVRKYTKLRRCDYG
ncbi:MAG: V-type ATP synthase subunit I [Candidatus Hydrothermarchaeota archaeon]